VVNLPCRPALLAAELAWCGAAVVVEGVPVAVMVAE
jgi:hypothetical protein